MVGLESTRSGNKARIESKGGESTSTKEGVRHQNVPGGTKERDAVRDREGEVAGEEGGG